MPETNSKNTLPWWKQAPEVEAVLAVGAFSLFAFVTVQVLIVGLPEENENVAMFILGALIGVVKDTFGRYFQATKGAQEQRVEAAKVAEKAASAVEALAGKVNAPDPETEGKPK